MISNTETELTMLSNETSSSTMSTTTAPVTIPMKREPIAIVGIGCRFPGSVNSYQDFIEIIKNGTDCLTEIPSDRWNADILSRKDQSFQSKKGGYLNDIDLFDNQFFGISPKEAQQMDPQQRVLLHILMEALEDAKISMDQIKGHNVGVFIGSSSSDYTRGMDQSDVNQFSVVGQNTAFLSNRISYVLDICGPSLTINSACSSSLVAIHLGCHSIWRGESRSAIVGGVNIISSPLQTMDYGKAGLLSKDTDARCHSFDQKANGYVRSEGAGILIIKPLSQALRDNDNIYSVILNSGYNTNGKTPSGITSPRCSVQEMLVNKVMEESQIDCNKIGYFECHGTGTQAGDLNELTAIGNAIGSKRVQPLVIGSVKSQMGHLEGASGVCGLLKSIICINEKMLPKQVMFETENQNIPFQQLNLHVPRQNQQWMTESDEDARIACVNSFGVGGSNSNIVISSLSPSMMRQYQPRTRSPITEFTNTLSDKVFPVPQCGVFNVSVNSDNIQDLKQRISDIRDFIGTESSTDNNGLFSNLCYTSNVRTNHLDNRVSIVTDSVEDLKEKLDMFLNDTNHVDIILNRQDRVSKLKLGFLFSGQGQQWMKMGYDLYQQSQIFRDQFMRCSSLFQAISGWSIIEKLFTNTGNSETINDTWLAQPSIFAIQVSLCALLKSLDLEPSVVIGHSLGELCAAYVSGCLTLEDSIRILYIRSHLQNQTTGTGKMIVAMKSKQEMLEIIQKHQFSEKLSISGNNSGKWVGVSGDNRSMNAFIQILDQAGITQRTVKINAGFHSVLMDQIKEDFYKSFNSHSMKARRPTGDIKFYSTTHGCFMSEDQCQKELSTADYWWKNIRNEVLFKDAMDQLVEKELDQIDGLLEISAHPVVGFFANQIIKDHPVSDKDQQMFVYPIMKKEQTTIDTLLKTLANLYSIGYGINWKMLYNNSTHRVLRNFPSRRWICQKFWIESPQKQLDRLCPPRYMSLDKRVFSQVPTFQVCLDHKRFNYLKDHSIQGQSIVPFTFYLELVHAALDQVQTPSRDFEVCEFQVSSSVSLDTKGTILSLTFSQNLNEFSIAKLDQVVPTQKWIPISSGKIHYHTGSMDYTGTQVLDTTDLSVLKEMQPEEFYQTISTFGYTYKDAFQGVRNCKVLSDNCQLSMIQLPTCLNIHQSGDYKSLHPSVLDACLQVSFAPALSSATNEIPKGLWVPQSVSKIKYNDTSSTFDIHNQYYTKSTLKLQDKSTMCITDLKVYDHNNQLQCQMSNIIMKLISTPTATSGESSATTQNANSLTSSYKWTCIDAMSCEQIQLTSNHTTLIFTENPTKNEDQLIENIIRMSVESGHSSDRIHIVSSTKVLEKMPMKSEFRMIVLPSFFDSDDFIVSNQKLFQLVQSFIANDIVGKMWLITSGAQCISDDDKINLSQYSLVGQIRTFATEYPQLETTMIDSDFTELSTDQVLQKMFNLDCGKWEIALRKGQEYQYSMVSGIVDTQSQVSYTQPKCERKYQVELGNQGLISDLTIKEVKSPMETLLTGQIEVRVEFSSLNFRDILKSLGRDYDSATVSTIGDEFSGVVQAVGPDCGDLKPGDKVFGILMSRSLSTIVRCQSDLVFKVPDILTLQDCCTLPITFLTAWYSICVQARLKPIDRILIHSAAGGVGLSALQIAQWIGADCYVTVGNQEKRQYLIDNFNLNPSHIFDSRSLQFHSDIMKVTKGKGVDVVLNSLSGEYIETSLSCLARYGRFVEIGKKDIYSDSKLGLLPFKNNLSYLAVDVAQMTENKRSDLREMMMEIIDLLCIGSLKPLPYTMFQCQEMVHAIRHMSSGSHIGKILVNWSNIDQVKTIDLPMQLSQQHSYMITGFGGLGQTMALEFSKRFNLKHLIVVSRSGISTPEQKKTYDKLVRYGTIVHVFKCDLSDYQSTETLFKSIKESQIPTIKGIFHTAGVLSDNVLSKHTVESFSVPLQSKGSSALNLHQLTQTMNLDYFTVIGSVTSLLGNEGQSNYSASNRFVEGLTIMRSQQNLAANCIHLGPVPEIGMAKNAKISNILKSRGFNPFESLQSMINGMVPLFSHRQQVMVYGEISYQNYVNSFPMYRGKDTFIPNVTDTLEVTENQLQSTKETMNMEMVEQSIKSIISDILEMKPELIHNSTALYNYGLDSLLSSELANSIQKKFGVYISSFSLLDKKTNVNSILQQIQSKEPSEPITIKKTVIKKPTIQKPVVSQMVPIIKPQLSVDIPAVRITTPPPVTTQSSQSMQQSPPLQLKSSALLPTGTRFASPASTSTYGTPLTPSSSHLLDPNLSDKMMTSPPNSSPSESPRGFVPSHLRLRTKNSLLSSQALEVPYKDPNELHTVVYEICPVAAPHHKYQTDIGEAWKSHTEEKDFMDRVYKNSKIRERYFFHEFDGSIEKLAGMTTKDKNLIFKELVQSYIIKAGEQVIERAGIDRNLISHVVGVTSTGIFAPSIDTVLIKHLKLPTECGRTMVNFMGCGAAVIALRTASVHAKARPGTFVLVVAVEASSLNLKINLNNRADIVSQCIFSDGCVAALVTTQTQSQVHGKFKIVDDNSYLMPGTEDALSMYIGNHGIDLNLRPELGKGIEENIMHATVEFLKRNNLTLKDMDFWAVHPGGRRILEAVAEGLKLPSEELSDSYDVMRKYGNMVSCSAFYVLRRIIEKNYMLLDEGSIGFNHGIMMAFSPGASIETIILKYLN